MTISKNDIKSIHKYKKTSNNNDDKFLTLLHLHLKQAYKNEGTRSAKMSDYKKHIKGGNLMANKSNLWKLGDRKLRNKLKKKVNEKEEKPIKEIKSQVIDKILNYKNSENPDQILILLIFASGRRITEFLKGSWKKEDNLIYIDKISKKRNNKKENYQIKTILPPDTFLKLLNKFKKYNSRSSTEGNRQAINRILKNEAFGSINSVSDLRPLYIQYLKTTEFKNIKSHQIIKKLLNHSNKTTSIYYNDVYNILDIDNLKLKTRKELKQLLNNRGKNKGNVKGFNRMNKGNLIKLF